MTLPCVYYHPDGSTADLSGLTWSKKTGVCNQTVTIHIFLCISSNKRVINKQDRQTGKADRQADGQEMHGVKKGSLPVIQDTCEE